MISSFGAVAYRTSSAKVCIGIGFERTTERKIKVPEPQKLMKLLGFRWKKISVLGCIPLGGCVSVFMIQDHSKQSKIKVTLVSTLGMDSSVLLCTMIHVILDRRRSCSWSSLKNIFYLKAIKVGNLLGPNKFRLFITTTIQEKEFKFQKNLFTILFSVFTDDSILTSSTQGTYNRRFIIGKKRDLLC